MTIQWIIQTDQYGEWVDEVTFPNEFVLPGDINLIKKARECYDTICRNWPDIRHRLIQRETVERVYECQKREELRDPKTHLPLMYTPVPSFDAVGLPVRRDDVGFPANRRRMS